MSDCKTMDDILSEFANSDPAGCIVCGQKLLAAHNSECEQLNTEIEATSKFNDVLNALMKESASECEKLSLLVKELVDELSKFHAWGEARILVVKASEMIWRCK